MLHHEGHPQLLGLQIEADLLGGLPDHRLADVLTVLRVAGGHVEQPVRIPRVGAAGQQDVGAAAQDQMDVDDLGVPVGRHRAGDERIAFVVDLSAPEPGVGGQVLVVDALRVGGEQVGERGGGQAGAVPHAFDQDEPPARLQQAEPVLQGRRRIGQQPNDVPGHDDVEHPLPDRGPGGVPDDDLRTGPGELGTGPVGHAGRAVDGGDAVALARGEQGEAAGAAPQVQYIGAGTGQPALQQPGPGVAHRGVEEPVVGLLVEGSGSRVPVDRGHGADALSRH